ncbi:hypothetical protein V8V91_10665 [Algoriphagus halophilus]|uniref:hypothetical protein n=1 Tax=Algoriphagus halophilus TaxID=226505 RepID=UPI00358E667D
MMKPNDFINSRKNKTLLGIAKNYILAPLVLTFISLLLKWVFAVAINDVNFGALCGIWIAVFLRYLLLDVKPTYLFNLTKTENYLILDLTNPIGKTLKVKVSLNELEKFEVEKRTFWRAFDKINLKVDGKFRHYKTVDRNLNEESFKLT